MFMLQIDTYLQSERYPCPHGHDAKDIPFSSCGLTTWFKSQNTPWKSRCQKLKYVIRIQYTDQLYPASMYPTHYNWNHRNPRASDDRSSRMTLMLCHRWCYRASTCQSLGQHEYQTADRSHHPTPLRKQTHLERTAKQSHTTIGSSVQRTYLASFIKSC